MLGANHAPILRQHSQYFQMDRNELPLEPRHIGVPFVSAKTIPKPMVRLAQTVHLSCTNTHTTSTQI